ncbi:MAG: DNA adenine methylase [Candidatus Gastranaerophilales bacterium]
MRYIGSKRLLLKNIEQVISDNIEDANSFCDIFSGTTIVARYFKKKYSVISNDLMDFSYVLQKAFIELNRIPTFKKLKKHINCESPIKYLNSLDGEKLEKLNTQKRFFQNNYAPTGGRMYLSDENALRIDYIRNNINDWRNENLISNEESLYLIASLIEAIPFVSNIAGTYGAYNKWWDKRALNKINLKELNISSNNKDNRAYNEDGNILIKEIKGDILYIDPPYNSRQYPPNYHLLETAALYDNPELKGVTGQRDYSAKKSVYCNKQKVSNAFEMLIKNAKFKHIILSYSNEGLMNENEIKEILCKYGSKESYKMYEIDYRRFKSNSSKQKKELKELMFYVRKSEC